MAAPAGRPDQHRPVAGILWMSGAALCFTISFTMVKEMQDHGMTVFQAVLTRQVFGLIIFAPVLVRNWPDILVTQVPGRHFFRAATGFLGMCTAYYSLKVMNLADSAALQFTLPFFTMFWAVVMLGERVRTHRLIATAIGFAGVLVIVRPGFAEINHGAFFALAGAAFYAASDTTARYVARYNELPSIMVWNFLFMIPLAAVPSAIWWVTPPVDSWPYVAGFAVAGVSAQFCLSRAFGLAEASLVSPVLFLRLPLVAAIGWVLYDQTTPLWTWGGATVIIGATLWMTWVETRRVPASGAAAEPPTESGGTARENGREKADG